MPDPAPSRAALLQQVQAQALAGETVAADDRPLVFVDSARQRLWLLADDAGQSCDYPVSTSRHGLGEQKDSFKTPRGVHRIAHKIGHGEAPGCVFKSRQPTGDICLQQPAEDARQDVITSRILWLEGMQPGKNCGGAVDSFERYIYIHGTADEAHIGQPASIGCIRMTNADVIDLFERVDEGDLVIID